MDLVPLKFAAASLGLSTGYVRALCRAHRVPGALFDGRRWLVPEDARVIHKASDLYQAAGTPVSVEARKQAEAESRLRRLATALSLPDGGTTAETGQNDQ
jgi:hypothetical protein